MDRYSIDSRSSDPLDFLTPPVKRIQTIYRKGDPFDIVNFNNSLLKDFCKNNTLHKPAVKTGDEPSTSLILQKTSQTQFLKQYSYMRYTSEESPEQPKAIPRSTPRITRNKPLIKVTVIPKTDQVQNAKFFRKRRHNPKKVQSTTSNQENSVQTKNVYLVVAGRRKEKIYEIRTTGSAEFSSEQVSNDVQNEETHLTEILNFKQLIRSLNMDKKKKKDKKKKINDVPQQIPFKNGDDLNEYVLNEEVESKNRVRIYGQLGLTKDDRYVLKYGASVDDEPIMSNVAQLVKDFSPVSGADNDDEFPRVNFISSPADCNKSTSIPRKLKDSYVQVNFETHHPKEQPSKGSQGTQVNFNIQFANVNGGKKPKSSYNADKQVQCQCCEVVADRADELSENSLKGCQSPLVIISVYPKEKPDKPSVDSKRSPSPHKSNTYNRNITIDKRTEKRNIDTNNREIMSPRKNRSPSPVRFQERIPRTSKMCNQESNDTENRIFRMSRENKSHERQSALKILKDKIQERDQQATSPTHSRFAASPAPKVNARKNKKKARETGTNTDHVQAKKALVDSYTKKLSAQRNQKHWYQPKIDTSKVTINIDGEKEYYDVQFNQDDDITDLTVRKTARGVDSHKSNDDESCAFLDDLMMLPNTKPRNKTLQLALYENHTDKPPLIQHSRLTIRDSLEISHRREDRTSQNTQTYISAPRIDASKNSDTDFFAPIKHFTGDDCSIYDPIARDKEIRQLLGVDNLRSTTSKSQQGQPSETAKEVLYHCFYRKNCANDLVAGISLYPQSRIDTTQCKKNVGTSIDQKINNNVNKSVEMTSLYQQLILNRNIQVFLQVEQFSKQKPIVLTRKQYDKVKRTIQKTISKKTSTYKKYIRPYSEEEVSVGEVKTKRKIYLHLLSDKGVQTEALSQNNKAEEKYQERDLCKISNKRYEFSVGNKSDSRHLNLSYLKYEKNTDVRGIPPNLVENFDDAYNFNEKNSAHKTISSVEVHYANVAYTKHVTFSSHGELSNTSLEQKASFFTIFRGHRKSPTPNLGTSAYSLYSKEHSDNSIKVLMEPRQPKPKKPLLRRLISCLVMRTSTSTSEPQLNVRPQPKSVNSSIDSYHISSSLAGVEVSSSVYDTSASFYSNHTVYPVNSKIKRGFFSSVRGFLANRKS